ncbi:MAG: VWA domain-containing protein [Bacteroidaceae bacterium]|nr:VWA domain-containing protein [Bacteroidaceae bacterium]
MMKKILTLLLLFATISLNAAEDVPASVKLDKCTAFLPNVLAKRVFTEKEAQSIAKSTDYGQSNAPSTEPQYWRVYSDRDNNVTYLTFNSKTPYGELRMNEPYRIAKIENGYALVYQERKATKGWPTISDDAESKGWVPMDKLLLWTKCPTNDHGIYNKALLVFNIDKANKQKTSGRVYGNPEKLEKGAEIQTGMNFYFIMKRHENGLVLLSTEYELSGNTNYMYGWVDESSYTPWNQRSCIEPNWDPDVVDKLVQKKEILEITVHEKVGVKFGFGKELNDDEFDKYRLSAGVLRYPILDNDSGNEDVYKCTAFATLDGSRLDEQFEKLIIANDKQREILEKLKNLNLIIVIDGTQSMEDYFESAIKAIQAGFEYFSMEEDNYKFKVGVVIYRDYADGEEGLVEYLPMIADPASPALAKFLKEGGSYGIKSAPADKTNAEALYKGLEVALDNEKMGYEKDESNMMIVIGDCGNDETDTQCLSKDEIVSRMKANGINLMTVQVRQKDEPAWYSFNSQVTDFLYESVGERYSAIFKGVNPDFEERSEADGYDLKPYNSEGNEAARSFFIGAMRTPRYTDGDRVFDPEAVTTLMKDIFMNFQDVIKTQGTAVYKIGNTRTGAQYSEGAKMDSAFLVDRMGLEGYKSLKAKGDFLAFSGYTPKKSKDGDDYWKSVLFISHDEFNELLSRLSKVEVKSQDRGRYVDAMKGLIRSMIPDVKESDMEEMSNGQIMDLILGLNERTESLSYSLSDINDPTVVSPENFRRMCKDFQDKYENLVSIKESEYTFRYENNGTIYYWLPIELLP